MDARVEADFMDWHARAIAELNSGQVPNPSAVGMSPATKLRYAKMRILQIVSGALATYLTSIGVERGTYSTLDFTPRVDHNRDRVLASSSTAKGAAINWRGQGRRGHQHSLYRTGRGERYVPGNNNSKERVSDGDLKEAEQKARLDKATAETIRAEKRRVKKAKKKRLQEKKRSRADMEDRLTSTSTHDDDIVLAAYPTVLAGKYSEAINTLIESKATYEEPHNGHFIYWGLDAHVKTAFLNWHAEEILMPNPFATDSMPSDLKLRLSHKRVIWVIGNAIADYLDGMGVDRDTYSSRSFALCVDRDRAGHANASTGDATGKRTIDWRPHRRRNSTSRSRKGERYVPQGDRGGIIKTGTRVDGAVVAERVISKAERKKGKKSRRKHCADMEV
ncbi:hypothetical protein OQA88_5548 [Cercophora sp. LCS_1]